MPLPPLIDFQIRSGGRFALLEMAPVVGIAFSCSVVVVSLELLRTATLDCVGRRAPPGRRSCF